MSIFGVMMPTFALRKLDGELIHEGEYGSFVDMVRGLVNNGANLSEADLSGAKLPRFQIPEGDLLVWKKCRAGVIVKLLIPAPAKRTTTPMGRKCRAEYVIVAEVFGAEFGIGLHDSTVIYRKGETVRPDSYNDDIRVECTNGIHFFLTREEAEEY